MRDRADQPDSEEPAGSLDAGLAAAYGGGGPHTGRSVLEAIRAITGQAPGILLQDEAADASVAVRGPEPPPVPRGRGTYHVLGEIAQGGMGRILKSHDADLGRDVAMKVLHGELTRRPEVLLRFVEEAQIGGQLQHPGIVPVYDLGLLADERPYFTMKLVKGRTLAALLSERPSPEADLRRLLTVFESVCQTVAYAHSRGVIHRDLKPANVMVGAFGEVQVVDWGLAKILRSGGTADEARARRDRTRESAIATVRTGTPGAGSNSVAGSVMGTPAYMPPEQARGETERMDERADVFALGAVLCEILTGAPPYTGESTRTVLEAANAALDGALARLDRCRADLELVALARECLAPAPHERPRTAAVVAERVQAYLTSVEDRARAAQIEAAEARVHAAEERRARRLTLGLALSVLLTLLVAGGGWAWMERERAGRERATGRAVGEALREATLLQAGARWPEAVAAAERARALARSGEADAGLRARVDAELADLRTRAGEARRADALARANGELLAALAEVRQPEGGKDYPTDWAELGAAYAAVFARFGLEPDRGDEEEAAAVLVDRGVGVELAAALDEWALVHRRAGEASRAARLGRLARRLDPDGGAGRSGARSRARTPRSCAGSRRMRRSGSCRWPPCGSWGTRSCGPARKRRPRRSSAPPRASTRATSPCTWPSAAP